MGGALNGARNGSTSINPKAHTLAIKARSRVNQADALGTVGATASELNEAGETECRFVLDVDMCGRRQRSARFSKERAMRATRDDSSPDDGIGVAYVKCMPKASVVSH